MTFLYLLIGLAVGFTAAWFYLQARSRNEVLQAEQTVRQELSQLEQSTRQELQRQLQTTEQARLLAEQAAARESLLRQRAESDAAELKQERDRLAREYATLQAERAALVASMDALKQQAEADAAHHQQRFDEQMATLKEQFQNVARQVLDHTSERLKSENTEHMERFTLPLRENLTQLRTAIEQTNDATTRNTASLAEQLRQMVAQTERMDRTATNLTNALRGDNKQVGDWGELVLSELLDAQGFVRGLNYDVQDTLTDDRGQAVVHDETGQRMRPDVILHYPDNEDVVIDAKVSIKAYSDYVAATDDFTRRRHLERHLQSVRSHVTELARKDYSRYITAPRRAVEFVIMFVPNDAALQLALANDPKLWQSAFEQKVFITDTQNLYAILRMISIAWRQHTQTENQKHIFQMAEELLKRVGDFVKRFDRVGESIRALTKDYDSAYNKAYSGKQSIVQKANELKALGVKESQTYPLPAAVFAFDDDADATNATANELPHPQP